MKLPNLFIWLFVLLPLTVFAQKERTVSGEYIYYAPANVSLEQAKQVALERAKIQAIAETFGTIVQMTTTTTLRNDSDHSQSDFSLLGASEVKGEWIETIGDPEYTINYENQMLMVKVFVKGRIREIANVQVDFNARILCNGTDDKFENDVFRNGDDLYLSFQSPVNGNLAVYLFDGSDNVYCLLPYRKQTDGQVSIKANKRYLFFSARDNQTEIAPMLIDEYSMTCSRMTELNRIYIIFSPNSFTKALDSEGTREELPRMLSYDYFQKWLAKCRRQDAKMRVDIKDIIIKK